VSRILVVDDEPSMREMLGIMLRKEGHHVLLAEDRASAAKVLGKSAIDLVVTDIKLPDGDGLEILRHVKSASPHIPVLVMTAYGSTETAVAALKLGASDYLVKPFDLDEFRIVVRTALEHTLLREENQRLRAEVRAQHGVDNVIGVSAAMASVLETVRSVASTTSTVLLTGESGTGKEVVAKAIHALSPRRDGLFVSINCGALPDQLLESELFGHMKGAFTDAQQNKKGLFEVAHRGTLFLDEVGDTPPSMQVKLLRALQERRIRRVGSTDEIPVDVRILAATNRPLEALVRERRFREDLYYRLNVIPLHLPALRERREDIPVLAEHFLRRFTSTMGKVATGISAEAMALLVRHSWPGNVRELENAIERALALESTQVILPERLPPAVLAGGSAPGSADMLGPGFDLAAHMSGLEREFLHEALRQATGDRARAAQLLGVSARALRYLVSKHGLGEGAASA
jgi:two-component system, NtrC family, response regulator PilR